MSIGTYRTVSPASLLPAAIRQCRINRGKKKLSDSTGASLTGAEVLTRAFALRRILRRLYLAPGEANIGIIMPPSVAGAVVNLVYGITTYWTGQRVESDARYSRGVRICRA